VVSERYTSVGELLPAVSKMFRVVDDDPLKFRAAVPERFVGDIKVGQKVAVSVEAYADSFPGTISRINPQIDPANRTFQVEILVSNDKQMLRPGGFARGRVQTHMQPDVVFVPQESVVTFAGVNKVFMIKDGKAAEVGVELGDRDGDEVEVLKGLKGTESVVVSGTSKLATGVPVEVKQQAPAEKQAAEAAVSGAPALTAQETGGRL
jgi:RND family efflux transporter MFP subunit